jgi:hypothetical protein
MDSEISYRILQYCLYQKICAPSQFTIRPITNLLNPTFFGFLFMVKFALRSTINFICNHEHTTQNNDNNNSDIAKEMKIDTTQTRYIDIEVFDGRGRRMPLRFKARLNHFLRKGKPFSKMVQAANNYWNEVSDKYDGSESVIQVMKEMNYKEQGELDAYIRWWMFDYEYTYSDVALINYYNREEALPTWDDTETFVRDPRGYESIIGKYIADNNIEPVYNVKVRTTMNRFN